MEEGDFRFVIWCLGLEGFFVFEMFILSLGVGFVVLVSCFLGFRGCLESVLVFLFYLILINVVMFRVFICF